MKHSKTISLKKTALTAAMAVALGTTGLVETSNADEYIFSLSGVFTMLDPGGAAVVNTAPTYYNSSTWGYGLRTPISGTLTYCTDGTNCTGGRTAGQGSMTIAPFDFQGGQGTGAATATGITFSNVGNGSGGAGNLLLGNMLFDWNITSGIPVSIVWDATGMLGALGPALSPGGTISSVGVLPASNGIVKNTVPIGPAPVAATTWNTTTIPGAGMGTSPSGQLPLITDTIGGSPMIAGPFTGFNANFDIVSMTVTSKNGVGLTTPTVVTTLPASGSTGVGINSDVKVTFTRNMTASTVAAGFTLKVTATDAPVAGAVTPATGTSDATFTFNPTDALSYSTQYTATLATTIQGDNGINLPAVYTWSFTTQAAPTGQACSTPSATVPLGSNFTMLDSNGFPFGGTNDVTYNLDFGSLNNSENGTIGILTNTLASALPHPFFGNIWTAHDIRLFGPGTYTFNSGCTSAELRAGISPAACAVNGAPLTMTVGVGQIGAHMLFDWNVSSDIDVVNVWDVSAIWNDPDLSTKNDLWTSALWAGPAGVTLDPDTTWDYVSTDSEGDGIIGVKMVDGPFEGYSANFNLGPASSCVGSSTVVVDMTISEDTQVPNGCSLSASKVSLAQRGDWWLVAGFLAWLGLARRRLARQRT